MIDLGNAKIGSLKCDAPVKFSGGNEITLQSGSATINGVSLEVGKSYTLKSGETLSTTGVITCDGVIMARTIPHIDPKV